MPEDLVPTREDILGHWFDGCKVWRVFRAPGSSQYIIDESGERCEGTFLSPGQTWEARCNSTGKLSVPREIAIHEAGHAIICVYEEIKVEWVNAVQFRGDNGQVYRGFCQYDYCLSDLIRAAPERWVEKVAKAMLGGQEAERRLWEDDGQSIPRENEDAWKVDSGAALDVLRKIFRPAEFSSDLYPTWKDEWEAIKQERAKYQPQLDRLKAEVRGRFCEPLIWAATIRVAERLQAEGAIDGRKVKELVEPA